jgi:hypothetical protein
MPKVLLITTLEAGTTFQSRAILNALGIESDVMYAVSSTSYRLLQPVSGITGALDPATTTMRNLLRRYQAVLINVAHDANANFTVYDPVLNVWMQSWNAPEDPPVIHFGQNLNTARTGLNLPADFPIVRANTADVPNTMWRWRYSWESPVRQGIVGVQNRFGTVVALTRENRTVYTRSAPLWWGTEAAAYLVDLARLGGQRELLAEPDFPDQARLPQPPSGYGAAFAVRYRNHYFLPSLHAVPVAPAGRMSNVPFSGAFAFPVFWLLYGLKLAGIQGARRIPLVLELDHTPETASFPRNNIIPGQSSTIRYLQQVQNIYALTEWLVSFAKPRGLQIVLGSRSGARYRDYATFNSHFWWMLHGTGDAPFDAGDGAAGRAVVHQVLKLYQANPDAIAFGVHDHTIPTSSAGGFNNTRWGTIQIHRHSDAGYRFAAPNPVPTRSGDRIVNRKVLPRDFTPGPNDWEFTRGRERFIDLNNTNTSTAAVYDGRDGTYWAAQVFLERNLVEHQLLGLPIDGYVGYTNNARNWHGGEGYWDVWVEHGFRGLRTDTGNRHHAHPSGIPNRLRYRGLQFVPTLGFDFCQFSTGFYHSAASYDDTAFGHWGLEIGTELRGANNEWMTDSMWRREKGVVAIRRYLSAFVDYCLWIACVRQGTFYGHPVESAAWIEPSRLLQSPWDGIWGNAYWSHSFTPLSELLMALDEVVQVLGDYLKWGTIGELLDLREAVG